MHVHTGLIDKRLKVALVIALCLHVGLIMAINFQAPQSDNYRPQIDVTLAFQPTTQAPDNATHAAQFNQQGSGDLSPVTETSSRAQPLSGATELPAALPSNLLPWPQPPQPRKDHNLVTRSAADRQVPSEEPEEEAQVDPDQLGITPEIDKLAREIAELEAMLNEQDRAYSDMPRVRRVTSAATRSAIDAAYLHQWLQRVEAVGNQYYPEASVRYGIYGSLRLLVVIDFHGRLEDIRILSSSGYALLDEAAIKIVRMAAPYPPFPAELRETTDKLEIIRTWQFLENGLSSG